MLNEERQTLIVQQAALAHALKAEQRQPSPRLTGRFDIGHGFSKSIAKVLQLGLLLSLKRFQLSAPLFPKGIKIRVPLSVEGVEDVGHVFVHG